MKKSTLDLAKPNFLPVTLGGISSLLGLVILTGGHLHIPSLGQVLAEIVPVQSNTALGFLLCGAGLLSIQFGKSRLAGTFGGFTAIGGVLVVIQYGLGIDLGIDRPLMDHDITIRTSHPGRMAPNTGLSFFLTGSALKAKGRPLPPSKQRSTISGILGSSTVAMGTIAFFGYLFALPAPYGWGQFTEMAVHTAVGFTVIGLCLIGIARRETKAGEKRGPWWPPLPADFDAIAVVLVLWRAWAADRYSLPSEMT